MSDKGGIAFWYLWLLILSAGSAVYGYAGDHPLPFGIGIFGMLAVAMALWDQWRVGK